MELFDIVSQIGSVVGVPAALLIGYLLISVKELKQKVEALEKARESDREKRDEELSKLYDKLNAMANDVSYIKGKMEERA